MLPPNDLSWLDEGIHHNDESVMTMTMVMAVMMTTVMMVMVVMMTAL